MHFYQIVNQMSQISRYNNQCIPTQGLYARSQQKCFYHSVFDLFADMFRFVTPVITPPPPSFLKQPLHQRRWWAICKTKSMEIIPSSEPPHYGKCNSDQDYTVRYHVGQHNSGWRSRFLINHATVNIYYTTCYSVEQHSIWDVKFTTSYALDTHVAPFTNIV